MLHLYYYRQDVYSFSVSEEVPLPYAGECTVVIIDILKAACLFTLQKNHGQSGGERYLDMNVQVAWANGFTGEGVVVCTLDDGVDHTHPDLAANYVSTALCVFGWVGGGMCVHVVVCVTYARCHCVCTCRCTFVLRVCVCVCVCCFVSVCERERVTDRQTESMAGIYNICKTIKYI